MLNVRKKENALNVCCCVA